MVLLDICIFMYYFCYLAIHVLTDGSQGIPSKKEKIFNVESDPEGKFLISCCLTSKSTHFSHKVIE